MTYQYMAMESGGRQNFQFPLSAAKKYNISSSSLRRHVDELAEKGFIKVQRNANLRKANDYAFSTEWKTAQGMPVKTT